MILLILLCFSHLISLISFHFISSYLISLISLISSQFSHLISSHLISFLSSHLISLISSHLISFLSSHFSHLTSSRLVSSRLVSFYCMILPQLAPIVLQILTSSLFLSIYSNHHIPYCIVSSVTHDSCRVEDKAVLPLNQWEEKTSGILHVLFLHSLLLG